MKVFIIVILSVHLSRTLFAISKSESNNMFISNVIMMALTILALIFTCNIDREDGSVASDLEEVDVEGLDYDEPYIMLIGQEGDE